MASQSALFTAPASARADDGGMREAAQRTLDRLEADGLLDETHALIRHMILQIAYRVGVELQAPKTSIAATHLLRSLTDLIELLPSAAESGGEAWQVFVQRVAELQSASGDAS